MFSYFHLPQICYWIANADQDAQLKLLTLCQLNKVNSAITTALVLRENWAALDQFKIQLVTEKDWTQLLFYADSNALQLYISRLRAPHITSNKKRQLLPHYRTKLFPIRNVLLHYEFLRSFVVNLSFNTRLHHFSTLFKHYQSTFQQRDFDQAILVQISQLLFPEVIVESENVLLQCELIQVIFAHRGPCVGKELYNPPTIVALSVTVEEHYMSLFVSSVSRGFDHATLFFWSKTLISFNACLADLQHKHPNALQLEASECMFFNQLSRQTMREEFATVKQILHQHVAAYSPDKFVQMFQSALRYGSYYFMELLIDVNLATNETICVGLYADINNNLTKIKTVEMLHTVWNFASKESWQFSANCLPTWRVLHSRGFLTNTVVFNSFLLMLSSVAVEYLQMVWQPTKEWIRPSIVILENIRLMHL